MRIYIFTLHIYNKYTCIRRYIFGQLLFIVVYLQLICVYVRACVHVRIERQRQRQRGIGQTLTHKAVYIKI